MNNNFNNNYSFDPMTGQPINQQTTQNTTNMYQQQPAQPQQSFNTYQQPVQPRQPKKNNKVFIIIAIVAVIAIIAGIFLFSNQDKKEPINNEIPNNSEIENKEETSNKDTSGKVEEGTDTTYDENGAFLFRIEDVFTITGRGTVVTGTVERGTINLNDEVQVIGLDKEIITTTVTGIEVFRKTQDWATVGDNPGLLLSGVERDQVERGQVVAKPNSIISSKMFDADISVLSKEEGGRHTPFFNDYSPQFYFRSVDISGKITLPEGVEMVMPGDNVSLTVTLTSSVAMEVGTEFSIREGGRTIASGKVTKVY